MLFNIVKGSPTKTIQTTKSCPHKVKLKKYLQQFNIHMIRMYSIQVQNINLYAHTLVKSDDFSLLWNITVYWVSKGLQDNESKHIFCKLQYSCKIKYHSVKTYVYSFLSPGIYNIIYSKAQNICFILDGSTCLRTCV